MLRYDIQKRKFNAKSKKNPAPTACFATWKTRERRTNIAVMLANKSISAGNTLNAGLLATKME